MNRGITPAVAALGLAAVMLASGPARAATYSGQLPPGASLPGASVCADRAYAYAGTGEVRPENTAANAKTGKGTFNGHVDGTSDDIRYGSRVKGNSVMSSGSVLTTTRQVLIWSACKWGLDQDVTMARAVVESTWRQATRGDFTSDPARCSVLGLAAPCYQSYGILQDNGYYHRTTYPTSEQRTPFESDHAGAWQRACYDGNFTWLGGGYGPGDIWGCVGAWYSGNWHDAAAEQYIGWVKDELSQRRWEKPGF